MLRQAELLEVRAHRLGRDAGVAEIGERRRAVPLRELRAVLAEQQAVVDVLGRLAAERADQLRLELGVRAMVGAANDVRDLEVEVVDRARELVRRRAVRAQQRRLPEAQRALGVRLADRVRRLAMAHEPLALAQRPLVPADAEPVEVATIASAPPSTLRAASVSSIRSRNRPPCSSAKRRFATALSALPRCSDPVGLGAKRTLTIGRV